MKFLTVLLYFISILHVTTLADAAEKKKARPQTASAICSADEISRFKTEYVKLQNAMKYEGKDIELINGKSEATGDEKSSDDSPGKKLEEALYNQYKNALIKVGKIYQKINKEPTDADKKMLKANPDLTKFFKAIDPKNTDRKLADNLNIETLLEKIKNVRIDGFELNDEDTYLLKKLLIHSQDRICTLEKYNKNKKSNRIAYLEQLKKSPLNKMIESLKSMTGTDLQLANEDTTISEAIKDSLAKLRDIIKDNKNCEFKLKNNPQLGDIIQTCNYIKFINSISANQFNEIESILHFLNANQNTTNARTGLDWINTQFLQESKTSCYSDPASEALYVQNFPLIDGKKIDTTKFSCSKGTTILSPEECIKGLSFNFEDKLGTKVSLKTNDDDEDQAITNFSIKGAENCKNLTLKKESKPETSPNPAEEETEEDVPETVSLENACKIDGPCQQNKLTGDMINLPNTAVISWDDKTKSCYSASAIGQPKVDLCTEVNCKKDSKKEWDAAKKECKDAAVAQAPVLTPQAPVETPQSPLTTLTDKQKCEKKDADWVAAATAPEIRTSKYVWDGKNCKDKKAVKSESEEEAPPESKPEVVYPNKPVPGRFQPITIPTRQVYILPGMP